MRARYIFLPFWNRDCLRICRYRPLTAEVQCVTNILIDVFFKQLAGEQEYKRKFYSNSHTSKQYAIKFRENSVMMQFLNTLEINVIITMHACSQFSMIQNHLQQIYNPSEIQPSVYSFWVIDVQKPQKFISVWFPLYFHHSSNLH